MDWKVVESVSPKHRAADGDWIDEALDLGIAATLNNAVHSLYYT